MKAVLLSRAETYIKHHKTTPRFHIRQALLIGESPLCARILQTLVRLVTHDKSFDWARLRKALLRHKSVNSAFLECQMEYVLAFMGFRWSDMRKEALDALCKGHRLCNKSEFHSTVQHIWNEALLSNKDPQLYAQEYLDMIDGDLKKKQKFMRFLMKKIKKFKDCIYAEEEFRQVAVRRMIREVKSEKRILHRMRRVYRRLLLGETHHYT